MELATDVGASAPATATPAPSSPTPVTIVDATPNIDASMEAEMEAVWAKMEAEDKAQQQPRDPQSKRFVSKDGAGKYEAAPNASTEQQAEPTEGATEQGAKEGEAAKESADPNAEDAAKAQAPAVEAPPTWSAEMRTKFQSLPQEFRDLQAYAAKRDDQQNQVIIRHQEQLKQAEQLVNAYEPLNNVLLAHKDDFARRGILPAQGVAFLLQAQRQLEQNPVGALIDIARSVNVDLAAVLQAAGIDPRQYGTTQNRPDPYVSQIEAKLNQALQKIDAFESRQVQQQTVAEQQIVTDAEQAIADFAKDKPYFEEVREDMGILLQAGRVKDLPAAYKKACAMNDSIASRIQADQRAKDEAKRKADEQAKAAEARKSAAVNVKSVPAKSNPTTIDDDLRAHLDRIYG